MLSGVLSVIWRACPYAHFSLLFSAHKIYYFFNISFYLVGCFPFNYLPLLGHFRAPLNTPHRRRPCVPSLLFSGSRSSLSMLRTPPTWPPTLRCSRLTTASDQCTTCRDRRRSNMASSTTPASCVSSRSALDWLIDWLVDWLIAWCVLFQSSLLSWTGLSKVMTAFNHFGAEF